MYIDTHAHLDDAAFDEDRADLIKELKRSGIDYLIDPGCDIQSTEKALNIASANDFIYYATGIHPENLDGLQSGWISEISRLAQGSKCVAIGEIGLDYYWDKSRIEMQKQVFVEQLELSNDLNKPVIIHDREAHGDCFEIIKRFNTRGVFHCFSGSVELSKELLKRGWYLGFDGPITYKNARKTIEVLEDCPLDRILLETDSPYLSPVPMRGKRNDSRNLEYIAQKIAEVKKISIERIAEITSDNAKELFAFD